MKKAFCLAITFLCHLPILAQFPPLHTIFAMGVMGVSGADPLLNKKEILLREGIKKITSHQTLPVFSTAFISKSIFLNKEGNVDSTIQYYKNTLGKTDTSFCSTEHYLYDTSARLSEIRVYDGRRYIVLKFIYEYNGENEVIKINSFVLSYCANYDRVQAFQSKRPICKVAANHQWSRKRSNT